MGKEDAVFLPSGTMCNQIALRVHCRPGDEVITPSLTWVSPVNLIVLLGARPVFVDVDPSTYNIDCEGLEDAIDCHKAAGKLNLRGIIPVDLFGLPADYDKKKILLKVILLGDSG